MRPLLAAPFAVLALAACPALAHTSYMLPSTFDATDMPLVTVESSFTEDFFAPQIAVDAEDFHVLAPDGSRAEFETVTPLRQIVVLEAGLDADGTYRLTTGERLGRFSREALMPDGEWIVLEDGEAAPDGATGVYSIQTATVADAYVSKGPLTRTAVDAGVGQFAIRPVTHPNDIFLGEGFEFELTLGEDPVANHAMTLYREGGHYEEPAFARNIVTDAQGHGRISFDRPGVYLLMTRHRAEAPAGAESDVRSYTTSLTFEVLP